MVEKKLLRCERQPLPTWRKAYLISPTYVLHEFTRRSRASIMCTCWRGGRMLVHKTSCVLLCTSFSRVNCTNRARLANTRKHITYAYVYLHEAPRVRKTERVWTRKNYCLRWNFYQHYHVVITRCGAPTIGLDLFLQRDLWRFFWSRCRSEKRLRTLGGRRAGLYGWTTRVRVWYKYFGFPMGGIERGEK